MADPSEEPPPPPKRIPKVKRGEGHDADRVKRRLTDFDAANCRAMTCLVQRFGKGIVNRELKKIAELLCSLIPDLKVDRDATRDGRVLIKWFDDNWDRIEPELQNIRLLDENQQPLGPDPSG
jgi:hypothetical protein